MEGFVRPRLHSNRCLHKEFQEKMRAVVLATQDVRKTYGSGETQVEALRGIDLAVAQGEMVAIMGPSGSGKSTLLCILGAVESPTSGKVLLEDRDLSGLGDDERTLMRRRRIGFVFQAFNLLPTLTALENVALPLELDGVPSKTAWQRARAALKQVGMSHRESHLPRMLSGGEQQRVAIARALVIEPALVLADEPTGNLDSASGERVIAILRELVDQRGQTVVLVTHDDHVADTADRIVRLRDGKIDSAASKEAAGKDAIGRPFFPSHPTTNGTNGASPVNGAGKAHPYRAYARETK